MSDILDPADRRGPRGPQRPRDSWEPSDRQDPCGDAPSRHRWEPYGRVRQRSRERQRPRGAAPSRHRWEFRDCSPPQPRHRWEFRDRSPPRPRDRREPRGPTPRPPPPPPPPQSHELWYDGPPWPDLGPDPDFEAFRRSPESWPSLSPAEPPSPAPPAATTAVLGEINTALEASVERGELREGDYLSVADKLKAVYDTIAWR